MSAPAVILSPHLDDAVLSCWHRLTRRGDVSVINVFAGFPPAGRTGWWDRLSTCTDSVQRMHERLEEDRRAMESLECHASNLDLLDHQYRDEPADVQALVEAIRTELSREAEIWAPAALTRHPDHVAVRTAALALNERVVLYADLPHASARGWPPFVVDGGSAAVQDAWCAALAATAIPVESLHARVHRLADEEYASKIELVRFYASQIATLERDFGRAIDDPDLLGYEVEWELSCSEAARRNPSASAGSATD